MLIVSKISIKAPSIAPARSYRKASSLIIRLLTDMSEPGRPVSSFERSVVGNASGFSFMKHYPYDDKHALKGMLLRR